MSKEYHTWSAVHQDGRSDSHNSYDGWDEKDILTDLAMKCWSDRPDHWEFILYHFSFIDGEQNYGAAFNYRLGYLRDEANHKGKTYCFNDQSDQSKRDWRFISQWFCVDRKAFDAPAESEVQQ